MPIMVNGKAGGSELPDERELSGPNEGYYGYWNIYSSKKNVFS
jgi:hypothetical protein